MRVTSPAVTIKDIWDAIAASYVAAGSFGKLLNDYLDAPVSAAKADLTTLETRLSALRAGYLDYLVNVNQAGLLQLTAARAGYLDELAAANLPADVDVIKADTPYLADAALPGTPVAGSIGRLVKDYLNAAVSSRLAAADYKTLQVGYAESSVPTGSSLVPPAGRIVQFVVSSAVGTQYVRVADTGDTMKKPVNMTGSAFTNFATTPQATWLMPCDGSKMDIFNDSGSAKTIRYYYMGDA